MGAGCVGRAVQEKESDKSGSHEIIQTYERIWYTRSITLLCRSTTGAAVKLRLPLPPRLERTRCQPGSACFSLSFRALRRLLHRPTDCQ